MSTPIKISLFKQNHRQNITEKPAVISKSAKLNPIVLLKRLPVSKDFTEQFLAPKKASSQKEDVNITNEVFGCLFCKDDQSFGSLDLLNEHMTTFHRIVSNYPPVTPRKVVPSSQRRTKVPDQTTNPDKSSQSKHQCYICALEFNLENVLNLHLEKVHHILDDDNQTIGVYDPSLPKLETAGMLDLDENSFLTRIEPTTILDRPKRQASLNAQKFFDDLEGLSDENAIDDQSDYWPEDHGSRNPSEVGEDVKGNLIEIVNETEMKEVPVDEAIPDEPIQESPKTNKVVPDTNQTISDRRCEICDKVCRTTFGLQIHKSLSHTVCPTLVCDLCPFKTLCRSNLFDNVEDFMRHQNIKHKVPYTCEFCDEKLADQRTRKRHVRSKHGKLRNKKLYGGYCDICKKTVTRMKTHIAQSHCEKVQCQICDVLLSARRLETHILNRHRTTERTKSFICGQCGKGYTSEAGLKCHTEDHESSPVCCDICGLTYKSVGRLEAHKKNSHLGQTFKCTFCDRVCKNKRLFNQHILSSHQFKTAVCELCGKEIRSHHLARHMKKMHQDHVCDPCGLKFKNSLQLKAHNHKEHQKISGFDPEDCPTCGKRFKTRFSLYKHIMFVHEKKSHFKCDLCPDDVIKLFTSNSHVKRHKLQVHKNDPRVAHLKPRIIEEPNSLSSRTEQKSEKVIVEKQPRAKRVTKATSKLKNYPDIGDDEYDCDDPDSDDPDSDDPDSDESYSVTE